MAWNRDAMRHAALQGLVNVITLPLWGLAWLDRFGPPMQLDKSPTPLINAAQSGDLERVRALLAQGADPNLRDNQILGRRGSREFAIEVLPDVSRTALMFAAAAGHIEIVAALLDAGADVNAVQSGSGTTALTDAIGETANFELVKLLIDRGANVNAIAFDTPLAAAATGRRVDLIDLLLERGADVNARDEEGFTALMEPARSGYNEIAERLIAAGIDVNARNDEGLTALHFAKKYRRKTTIDLLESAGAHE